MAQRASKCFLFSILSLISICSSGRFVESHLEAHNANVVLKWEEEEGRKLSKVDRETISPPTTIFPTTPDTSTPTIITVPATNPVTVTPLNPAATPASVPSTTPITIPTTNPPNPVAPPFTVPGAQPITNPVTTYPAPSNGGGAVPVPVSPPNAPVIPGQSWCVARTGASEAALQSAIDYACGIGGADCSQIQQGGNCYNPNTLENHASFAFNSYFQKNPTPTSCDFGGTAVISNSNPSSGSCIYPLSSSSSSISSPSSLTPSVPTPTTPTTPTPIQIPPTTIPIPTTSSPAGMGMPENGAPPTVFNTSNPDSSIGSTTGFGFGNEIPPSSTISSSASKPLNCYIITLMVSLFTRQVMTSLCCA